MENEKLKSLFDGSENLTEEFKTSVATIFNEAVEAKQAEQKVEFEQKLQEAREDLTAKHQVQLKEMYDSMIADHEADMKAMYDDMMKDHGAEIATISEQVEAMAEKRSGELVEEVAQTVDNYLKYAVESFVKDNEEALQDHFEKEISGDFIKELAALFAKYNMACPEKAEEPEEDSEKEDEFEAKEEQYKQELDEAYETISSLIDQRTALEEQIHANTRANLLHEAAFNHGLSEAESANLEKLIEGFVGDEKEFAEKANDLAETIACKSEEKDEDEDRVVSEETPEDPECKDCKKNPVDEDVAAVLRGLNALKK